MRGERRRPRRQLGETVYCGHQGGVIAFTKALRARWRATTCASTACAPGRPTRRYVAVPEKIEEAFARHPDAPACAARESPTRSCSSPALSDFVTGQVLSVSGGLTMAG